MATQLLVAIISAVVALVAAAITIWGQTRSTRLASQLRREEEEEKHKQEAKRLISRYREPLVHAAFDLQSRIYNFLELQMIDLHYDNGSDRTRAYVVDNTAFLIAQYFGWSEIFRQEGLFLDLGESSNTRRLNEIQDNITHAWLRGDLGMDLCIFKGNQRVIGEEMIRKGPEGLNCATYGEFLSIISDENNQHLLHLKQDVKALVTDIEPVRSRLILLQNVLINLIDFLDPNYIRFPKNRRTKLPA